MEGYMITGSHFYDQNQNFKNYLERRSWNENANDTIEKPIFMALINGVEGQNVLDLGCGTASFGNEILDLGATTYTGIEGSINMVNESKKILNRANGHVIHTSMEEWDYPNSAYHLIVSRLAIHYIHDVSNIFNKVYKSLVQGGKFVFSVEHPVMTSSYGVSKPEGYKQEWLVDNYFHTGVREQEWLGGKAVKYHRTIEDYFHALQNAGFTIESLKESI